jgi:arylsulfatase A-like enzyme
MFAEHEARRGMCELGVWTTQGSGPRTTLAELLQRYDDVTVQFETDVNHHVARWRVHNSHLTNEARCVYTREVKQNINRIYDRKYVWFQKPYLAPSVVFFWVDDLRMPPENMDNVLNFGISNTGRRRYQNAFTNIPVCGGSRISLMTTTHPLRQLCPTSPIVTPLQYTAAFRNRVNVRNVLSEVAARGYKTASMGKVFHNHWDAEAASPGTRDPNNHNRITSELQHLFYPMHHHVQWCREENDDCASCDFSMTIRNEVSGVGPRPNYITGNQSIGNVDGACDNTLDDLTEQEAATYFRNNNRFFAIVGFTKPHLPFVVHQSSLDAVTHLSDNQPDPPNVLGVPYPPIAPVNYEMLGPYNKYRDVTEFYQAYGPPGGSQSAGYNWPAGVSCINNTHSITGRYCYDVAQTDSNPADVNTLPELAIRNLRRFYYASTYETMQRLRRLTTIIKNTNPNTCIIFSSDHGFSLGEHAFWAKHRMYRSDVRIPMEVAIPLQEFQSAGNVATDAQGVASLVDVVPTSMEWLGFPMQGCDQFAPIQGAWCTDGRSLLPASAQVHGNGLEQDTRAFRPFGLGTWTNAYDQMASNGPQQFIYSAYPRNRYWPVREVVPGHTIYGDNMRLTYWVSEPRDIRAEEAARLAEPRHLAELYDHTTDPLEMHNIYDPTNRTHIQITQALRRFAEQGSCPVDPGLLRTLRAAQQDYTELGGFIVRRALCGRGAWHMQTTPPTPLSTIMTRHNDFSVQFLNSNSDNITRWRVHDNADDRVCLLNDNSNTNVYYLEGPNYLWFQRIGTSPDVGGASEPVTCGIGNHPTVAGVVNAHGGVNHGGGQNGHNNFM